jgi:Sec-independent protein translocase protein TatA
MSFFGVGGWELMLILLIALIVAGPKRMLEWAYYAGRALGKLRVMWGQVMETIQQELDESGVDVKLPKTLDRREINRSASQFMRPFTEEVRRAEEAYREEMKKADDAYQQEVKALDASIRSSGEEHVTNDHEPQQAASNGAADADKPDGQDGFGTWSASPPKQD